MAGPCVCVMLSVVPAHLMDFFSCVDLFWEQIQIVRVFVGPRFDSISPDFVSNKAHLSSGCPWPAC